MTDTDGGRTTSDIRTFLIADIRGYTRFTESRGDEAAGRLTARFAEITHEVVAARGGTVTELRGDEALAVFGSTRSALRAAVEAQVAYARPGPAPMPSASGTSSRLA